MKLKELDACCEDPSKVHFLSTERGKAVAGCLALWVFLWHFHTSGGDWLGFELRYLFLSGFLGSIFYSAGQHGLVLFLSSPLFLSPMYVSIEGLEQAYVDYFNGGIPYERTSSYPGNLSRESRLPTRNYRIGCGGAWSYSPKRAFAYVPGYKLLLWIYGPQKGMYCGLYPDPERILGMLGGIEDLGDEIPEEVFSLFRKNQEGHSRI